MSDANTADVRTGDWEYFGRELWKRTREPIKEVPFVLYVFLANILFGCLGIWIEVVKISISSKAIDLEGVITAVITFFPTLIGPTTLQLVFASARRNDTIFVSFALLVLCLSLAAAILLSVFSARHSETVLILGVACSISAIWMWWITNGGDPTYKKITPPDAATGGRTDRSLQGTLTGYQA